MKLEDLYLINKEEWLDVIKDKCKKKAKTHFCIWLVLLILFLVFSVVPASSCAACWAAICCANAA